MKIGIDARFHGEAGPGRYAKNITEHLEQIDQENDYLVFLRKKGYEDYHPTNPRFKKVLADYKWYSWEEQVGFLLLLLKSKLDLFYVPHFNIPVFYPGKIVTAIPDIIMHTFSTEKGTTLFKPYFKLKKLVYRLVVWWAVVRSKKVIVPSKDVINDFIKFYPKISAGKYVLAYEGVDPTMADLPLNPKITLEKYGIQAPFILYVGSMYEHKNILRLLQTFKLLQERYGFEGELVLVGKKDKFSEGIKEQVEKMGLSEAVLMPGMSTYVTDEEVTALRKTASLCVFPSLKEGFSLTPLESQQIGLPCVISDIPCHKEVYGDSVVYFNPNNTEDMAEKINRVLKDEQLRNSLKQKGYEQVKKYSWMDTAKITLDIFNHALKNA